jgi:hypothetical protein
VADGLTATRSGVQARSATEESAPAFIEAQEAMCGFRDSDAATDAHAHAAIEVEVFGVGMARRSDFAEPQWAGGAEVDAIDPAVDVQSLGQTARAASEVVEFVGAAAALHFGDAFERFECANQDAATYSGRFGAYIEHEVVAIGEVDVGVAGAQEHGRCARSRTAVVVGGRITWWVGFGLYNAAGHSEAGEVANDDLTDEVSRELDRADG